MQYIAFCPNGLCEFGGMGKIRKNAGNTGGYKIRPYELWFKYGWDVRNICGLRVNVCELIINRKIHLSR